MLIARLQDNVKVVIKIYDVMIVLNAKNSKSSNQHLQRYGRYMRHIRLNNPFPFLNQRD